MNTLQKAVISALLLSVALNLVFIGGISYRVLDIGETRPRPLPPNIGWAIRDLNPERRDEIRNELGPPMSTTNNEIPLIRSEVAQAQQRVNELMTADNFSEENLSEAFLRLRDAESRYQQLSHQQTARLLSRMTHEERLAARQFIERRGARGNRNMREAAGPRSGPRAPGMRGPRDSGGRPAPESRDQ